MGEDSTHGGAVALAPVAPRAVVHAHEYDYDNGVGKRVWSSPSLQLESVEGTALHEGIAAAGAFRDLTASKWLVAVVELLGAAGSAEQLKHVELFLGYDSRSTDSASPASLLV